MNKTQSIKNAINHKSAEKVPYAINFTRDGIDLYGEKLIEDYSNKQVLDDYKKGILNLKEAVSLSIGDYMLWVHPPWWRWHNVPTYFRENYDAPSHLPKTIGHGDYDAFFEKMQYIKDNYDVYILCTIWGSHIEKAINARGIENLLADLAGSPRWAKSLLDMIIRKNIVMLENILDTDTIDGVMLGSDWGSQNDLLISPTCWRNMIKEGERQEYDLVKSYDKNVFVHSCGNIEKIIPDLIEIGLDVLNPLQPECMDIYNIKEKYGDDLSFFGGISTQKTLPFGTPQEVVDEVNKVIDSMSINGGYITSPAQEIQTDVPYENVRALIDTARKRG